MSVSYCIVEIYTSEEARWKGAPLWEAIVNQVARSPLVARCLVTKAVAGAYENGELSSSHLEVLSYNMPVKVEIVLPAGECERLLRDLEGMVTDGIVAVREAQVAAHQVKARLIPRQLRVRDVMAASPASVSQTTPVSDIIRLLLTAEFNAVPVVDEQGRPVGIITQGDLIERAHMPIRLGLLAELDRRQLEDYLQGIQGLTAAQVMTTPVVTIDGDKRVDQLVQTMLKRRLKRLPVVDREGRLIGVVARLDVFGIIARSADTTQALAAHHVSIGEAAVVADIMTRELDTVGPDASGAQILDLLRERNVQRLAVVDDKGVLLGLITDLDILTALSRRRSGFWDYLSRPRDLAQAAAGKTATQIMKTDLVTVTENTPVEEAVRLMAEHGLKRLPVVDAEGRYRGMIARQDVLRAGTDGAPTPGS
jgi:CBS domain-containing protein